MSSCATDFSARYLEKRSAGWSSRRVDGSSYSGEVDQRAGEAEAWAARACGSEIDARVFLHGDPGWDFETTDAAGRLVRVDVIHIGDNRDPATAHLIVNPENKKLRAADVFLVVGNVFDFWYALGAIARDRFLAIHQRRNFGFGEKLAVHCRQLECACALLPQFAGRQFLVGRRTP